MVERLPKRVIGRRLTMREAEQLLELFATSKNAR